MSPFAFEWLASSDSADGYVVIQEDSGNNFGERTFISKVEIGTPMTYYATTSSPVLYIYRYHVSEQSNPLMAPQPKQSKSGIDRYSIPLWPGGGNGA